MTTLLPGYILEGLPEEVVAGCVAWDTGDPDPAGLADVEVFVPPYTATADDLAMMARFADCGGDRGAVVRDDPRPMTSKGLRRRRQASGPETSSRSPRPRSRSTVRTVARGTEPPGGDGGPS